jgi:hypothetical protein
MVSCARQRCCLCIWLIVLVSFCFFAAARTSLGSEGPYFVTYDQNLEKPGDLELGLNGVQGKPRAGNSFVGSWIELEYGTRAWWTTEFYLDGQWTRNESTAFTGFRIENRFRPFQKDHFINPVLYVEYENLNAADKILQEIVGFDSQNDTAVPNEIARREREREIETRLILGSDFKGWNLSGNFVAEKNLANHPWEFGYAAGISHSFVPTVPLGAGIEFCGGLGDWNRFTLRDTSQYLGPSLAWKTFGGTRLRVSAAFGLTPQSHGLLIRVGVSHGISHINSRIRSLF